MSLRNAVLAFAITIVSTSAHASNFSYTFLQGNAGTIDFDDSLTIGNEKYDGAVFLGGVGSYQSEEDVTLEASINHAFNDGDNSELSSMQIAVLGGYPFPVEESIDLYPQVGLVRTSAEVCAGGICGDTSDSGGVAQLSARAWLSPDQLEIGARVSRTTLDNADTAVGFNIGWWLNPDRARVSLAVSSVDDETSMGVGIRAQF